MSCGCRHLCALVRLEILDEDGASIFNQLYESGRISGDTYMVSGKPSEKVNETLHRVLYDLLEQSFADARPVVLDRLGIPSDTPNDEIIRPVEGAGGK